MSESVQLRNSFKFWTWALAVTHQNNTQFNTCFRITYRVAMSFFKDFSYYKSLSNLTVYPFKHIDAFPEEFPNSSGLCCWVVWMLKVDIQAAALGSDSKSGFHPRFTSSPRV